MCTPGEPSFALPWQWLTGRIIAARPNTVRRQAELCGDDSLHRRPWAPQRLAGGSRMIPVYHRKAGESEAAFFQGGQHVRGMPVQEM